MCDGAVPQGWVDALADSEADIVAGRLVSSAVIQAELRQAIAEIEAELTRETQVVPET